MQSASGMPKVCQRQKSTSSAAMTLRVHKAFKLSRSLSSHGVPETDDHPSSALSTPFRLPVPSEPPRMMISTTISLPPDPSPPDPNTSFSDSCNRSEIGVKTPQNFSGVDIGGGGVRYDEATCVSSTGGWAIRWVREGENLVEANWGIKGHGARTCKSSRKLSIMVVKSRCGHLSLQ